MRSSSSSYRSFLWLMWSRLEEVSWKRRDGLAKIAGVGAVVVGALVLVTYQGAAIGPGGGGRRGSLAHRLLLSVGELASEGRDRWRLGVICLLGNCICVAFYYIIQVSMVTS